MGKQTGISWTDHTWNPWQGCRKVSPGCANCYMYRDKARYGQDAATVIRSSRTTFQAPLRWSEPAKVFVCSWSDFFIEDSDPWRGEAWEIMRLTPHLTYQVLTKRPENIKGRLPEGWPLPNVWLGVTAENQEMADRRIQILLETPAALRFVSVEPMVGPIVFLEKWLRVVSDGQFMNLLECGHGLLRWVIVGGETGPGARMMCPEWALSIKQQCAACDIPFFMKQMTNKAPVPIYLDAQEFPK